MVGVSRVCVWWWVCLGGVPRFVLVGVSRKYLGMCVFHGRCVQEMCLCVSRRCV